MSSLSSLFSQDILDWLKTGSYSGLTVGMTHAECMERTGLSEVELASNVWPVELKFEEPSALPAQSSLLQSIYTEDFGEFTDADVTIDDIKSHRETVRLEKVICLLDKMDIPFIIYKTSFKRSSNFCIRIETQHRINLIFYISQDKEGCLLESMQQYTSGYRTYFYSEEQQASHCSDL